MSYEMSEALMLAASGIAKQKVINLWAEPGAGKSTTAAGLFNLLKRHHIRCEIVTEAAKELIYQGDKVALQNQLYVLAQQDIRLHRLRGQVEWVITDSPLPLCHVYAVNEYRPWILDACWGAWRRYDNYNIILTRAKPYQHYGRRETEGEALALRSRIMDVCETFADTRHKPIIAGDHNAPYAIAEHLGIEWPLTQ